MFWRKSLVLARRAFLFSLRRRCTKSLPSEVSLSMFTSSYSVLFLILLGVFVRFMVVFVQLPTELSSFTGRTPESLPKSPSDHMVPTLVVALPLLLLSYTYFNYNFTVLFCPYHLILVPTHSLLPYFKIWNGRPKMLYTQTSLSLVYNLERVSKSPQCYSATYQTGIVAWLRLEPNSYSTKLYSLHRRCSFGPVAVALGQLSESFVLSAALLLLGVVCV